jgi:hypothetical protein
MIGGAVIVISGCYIILRERQQRGRAVAAAVDTGSSRGWDISIAF